MNVKKLEQWYLENKRDLPFRDISNPYYIWISEIMLQQTQVDTVIPYFNQFIKTYPTIKDLAHTSEAELLLLVQGLGYYGRFKNMLKTAITILDQFDGEFPRDYKTLLKLPGVGDYTGGAIMSIAYNEKYPATDGNVIRVLSRFYNIDLDMSQDKHKKVIKAINQSLIDQARPNIYTPGIMELGALICRPKQALCGQCPVSEDCKAFELNKQNTLPIIIRKDTKKVIDYKVFIIEEDDYIYLRKRKENLLGGMYEYPQYEDKQILIFDYEICEDLGLYSHTFTHLIWKMNVLRVKMKTQVPDDWIKIKKEDLSKYPMAVAHRKIQLK